MATASAADRRHDRQRSSRCHQRMVPLTIFTSQKYFELCVATIKQCVNLESSKELKPSTKMKTFDITTDAGSQTIEAETLADALREWAEAPAKVTTAEAWETWLEKLGGFGSIQEDGVIIARVAS